MTSSIPRARRRASLALAAGALAMLAAFGPASPVSAHDQLISTDPSADAVVEALPAAITFTYSAELLSDGGSNIVEVTDATGNALADGPAVVDGVTLTQALTGTASGPLTVLWRVVSSDGHPISGEFAFTVEGAATPTAEPTEAVPSDSPEPTMTTMTTPAETSEPSPSPTPDDEASVSNPLPWVIGAVIVLVVIGVVVYLLVIRPRRRGDDPSNGTRPGAEG